MIVHSHCFIGIRSLVFTWSGVVKIHVEIASEDTEGSFIGLQHPLASHLDLTKSVLHLCGKCLLPPPLHCLRSRV